MRRRFAVALAVLTVSAVPVAGAETDMDTCANGASAKAVAACTRLIDSGQLAPDKLAGAYGDRASAELSARNADAALADADAAIRLAPMDGVLRMGRGDAFRAKGDDDKALADYDAAANLQPNLWRAHYMRGYMLEGSDGGFSVPRLVGPCALAYRSATAAPIAPATSLVKAPHPGLKLRLSFPCPVRRD